MSGGVTGSDFNFRTSPWLQCWEEFRGARGEAKSPVKRVFSQSRGEMVVAETQLVVGWMERGERFGEPSGGGVENFCGLSFSFWGGSPVASLSDGVLPSHLALSSPLPPGCPARSTWELPESGGRRSASPVLCRPRLTQSRLPSASRKPRASFPSLPRMLCCSLVAFSSLHVLDVWVHLHSVLPLFYLLSLPSELIQVSGFKYHPCATDSPKRISR